MNLHPAIAEILNHRGVCSPEDLEEFLSERPQKTYDPFLLPHMDAGVDLVLSACQSGEKICIYGDYDADGVTSTVLMLDVLQALAKDPKQITCYIPSRFDEGYGLNSKALDKIQSQGVSLVLTVDCGSVSVEEVAHAKELGLAMVVTDHHKMGTQVPDCPVINPVHPESAYPFPYLAGVGVAFKLAQALAARADLSRTVLLRNLDLVAIGTIGDVVPLQDENRTLVKFGLRALRVSTRPGLVALLEKNGIAKSTLTSEQVAFGVVPPINASGRMKSAYGAVRMLAAKTVDQGQREAEQLLRYNQERRAVQATVFDQCVEEIQKMDALPSVLILNLEDAHEGITGIVAGRLKDTYHVPAVLVTATEDGCYKGTGRAPEGIHLYDLLAHAKDLYLRFGGHSAACGFTLPQEAYSAFRQRILETMEAWQAKDPTLGMALPEPDAFLAGEELDQNFLDQQLLLEPFGKGNPKPLIAMELQPGPVTHMGADGKYLKFQGTTDCGTQLECVVFQQVETIEPQLSGESLTVLGNLERRTWRGRESIQMIVTGVEA